MLKFWLRKIVPEPVIRVYHWVLSYLAALMYRNPSSELIVIGVTGTLGKSTTVEWIGRILEHAGERVGWAATTSFKVGRDEWANKTKMTMLGRFQTQKMLRRMVRGGCRYAVIETTSQGIAQFRHLGINYDVVLLTNLSPEHVEAHGGFENYKSAKGRLFEHLSRCRRKVFDDEQVEKTKIINIDNEHAEYFLGFESDKTYGFGISGDGTLQSVTRGNRLKSVTPVVANNVKTTAKGSSFMVHDQKFELAPLGLFNVYNALAAISVGLALGFDIKLIADGLARLRGVPGRLEVIDEGQPFTVIVDFAYEPTSLSKLFEAIEFFKPKRVIHVTGSTGGGRDVARRPILGKMSAEFADVTIVTNEDPYDDDPMEIIDQVAAGAIKVGSVENKDLFKILDRAEAINKAIGMAEKGDIVLITGKGSEAVMAVARGKLIPWDDRAEARKALRNRIKKQN